MNTVHPSLLTLNELAREWQVSPKTLRRLVARGELKVHRIGAQIRVSLGDKAAFEKLHRS
jgi:excisionase family DNA binding protein